MFYSQSRQFDFVHVLFSVQTVCLCTCFILSPDSLSFYMFYSQFRQFANMLHSQFRQFANMLHSQFRQFEVVHILSSDQTVCLCTCFILSPDSLSVYMFYSQSRQFVFVHVLFSVQTVCLCTCFILSSDSLT